MCSVTRRVAVQAFLVEQDRYAEARIACGMALNRVDQLDGLTLVEIGRGEGAADTLPVAGAREMSDTHRMEPARRALIELTGRVEKVVLRLPDCGDLRDLL